MINPFKKGSIYDRDVDENTLPNADPDQTKNSLMNFTDKALELLKKLNKFSVPNEQNKNSEMDALAELSTLDQKVSDIRKKTLQRIFGVMMFLSVGLFLIFVFAKWGLFMWRDSKRPEVQTKVQELKLEVNPLNKWQEIKDQQINQLGDDIKKVEANVDKKMNEVQNTISSELNDTKASVTQSLVVLQEANKQTITDALSDIKNEIKSIGDDAKQYTDQKNLTISEKIAQIESRKKDTNTSSLDYSKLSLPPLPQIEGKQGDMSPSQIQQKLAQINQKPQYVEDDINDNSAPLNFSTMTIEDNNTTIVMPKMTMMAGVQRATLVAGADVPTLQKGNDLTRVVWLSTSGEMLISNGHTANIRECILQAAATGNFATSSADIRLTKISCSALDNDGKYYKLVGNVKGWVNGETGKQGLKGRLVTKEGELIEKAVPLAILEGAIKALENSTKSSSTVYTYPGATSTTTADNLKDSFTEGTTKTASTTLDKFSDYYLMILEQLNPTIELKAGREVSIWFEGGEQLTMEEYTPLDVDYFEHKGFEQ